MGCWNVMTAPCPWCGSTQLPFPPVDRRPAHRVSATLLADRADLLALFSKDAAPHASSLRELQLRRDDDFLGHRFSHECKNHRRTHTFRSLKQECPLGVKSALLSFGRSLPVCPYQQTFSRAVGMSQRCQTRKSGRPVAKSGLAAIVLQKSFCGMGLKFSEP